MSNANPASDGAHRNANPAADSAHPTIGPDPGQSNCRDGGVDQDAMLSLMSDDYARSILDALGEQSLSARELLDRLDASRATVYRRLDELESAGILESSMSIHPDGHHRKEYQVVVERVHLTFGSDGVGVELTA